MEFSVKLGMIRLSTSFSRIFAKKGNRLIDRNEEMASSDLLGLTMIIYLFIISIRSTIRAQNSYFSYIDITKINHNNISIS